MDSVNQPLVSIVIACYNHQNFVQTCIKSIINQSYDNIELIIIDDGSKDCSVEKINEMIEQCKKRFTRFEFRHRPNKGLTATLNEALEWCQGEYYCPFASDDIMLFNRICLQVDYLQSHLNCAGIFGAYQVVNQAGNIEKVRKKKNKTYYFKDIFLHKHELPAPTQLLRMSIIKNIGGYCTNIVIEDWYMWLKITHAGYTLDYINVVSVQYRKHEGNISNKLELILNGRIEIVEIYKDNNLFEKALANIYLVSANEYLIFNVQKSKKMYLKYIEYKGLFMSMASIKYILKYILRNIK